METLLVREPRSPFVNRTSYTCILQFLSLAGKAKDVRYEHLRDALLIMHDISSTISPCHLWTNRGLSLANNHRNAIDDEHQIKALASLLAQSGVLPLIGNDTAVLILLAILILSVAEETDVDVIAIRSNRI